MSEVGREWVMVLILMFGMILGSKVVALLDLLHLLLVDYYNLSQLLIYGFLTSIVGILISYMMCSMCMMCNLLLVWHYSKNGIYIVKLGYCLACLVNHIFSQLCSEEGWKKLWQIEVPRKVRSFIWRLCWDFLPTRVQLTHQHICIRINCVFLSTGCGAYLAWFFGLSICSEVLVNGRNSF